jgi:two-component system, NtrC family, response regulator AtoC
MGYHHAPVSDPARDNDTWTIEAGVRLLAVGVHDPAGFGELFRGSEVSVAFARAHDHVLAAIDALTVDAVYIEGGENALPPPVRDALRTHHPDLPLIGAPMPNRAAALRAVRSALLLSYGDEGADGRLPSRASDLVGTSPAMQRLRETVARAAASNATVLVRGETGTGKELVAQALHRGSARAGGPMVTIHCGALPESLIESELFGHEKGAFTGAVSRKAGRVETASKGTLFLDEIGEITPSIQVKLLRLLQSREFSLVGSSEAVTADVRFVAATHRDLESMVKAGTFREDLFYRLNVITIWVPPLRARGADVHALAVHMCKQFADENGRGHVRFTQAALEHLGKLRWPGNVRQLQNFVERLVVLGGDCPIDEDVVARALVELAPLGGPPERTPCISSSADRSQEIVAPLDDALKKAERKAIARALAAAGNNRSKAARLLGISRASLYNKLGEHGLP